MFYILSGLTLLKNDEDNRRITFQRHDGAILPPDFVPALRNATLMVELVLRDRV